MPNPKPTYLKPKKEIAKEVLRFRELKYDLLNTKISKNETKSVWYSYAQIKELWDEIQYQTANGKKVSGARIYLTSFLDGNVKYAKQMNTVFVLTEDIGTATPMHKDFFIEEQADYGSRPAPVKILGLDHGTPCPPDCAEQDPEWP
jgi:hypothetical protein